MKHDHVLWGLLLALTVLFGIGIYAGVHLVQRIDKCESRSGIMVKTSEGYRCFNKSVLIE